MRYFGASPAENSGNEPSENTTGHSADRSCRRPRRRVRPSPDGRRRPRRAPARAPVSPRPATRFRTAAPDPLPPLDWWRVYRDLNLGDRLIALLAVGVLVLSVTFMISTEALMPRDRPRPVRGPARTSVPTAPPQRTATLPWTRRTPPPRRRTPPAATIRTTPQARRVHHRQTPASTAHPKPTHPHARTNTTTLTFHTPTPAAPHPESPRPSIRLSGFRRGEALVGGTLASGGLR